MRDGDRDRLPDRAGDTVTVEGVVTARGGLGRPYAVLQDASGGVRVVEALPGLLDGVVEGDVIRARGVVHCFEGDERIRGLEVRRAGRRDVPSPVPVAAAALQGEEHSNRLVVVTGILRSRVLDERVFSVEDASGEVLLRLSEQFFDDLAFGDRLIEGGAIQVVGIAGQNDDEAPFEMGYRLSPRRTQDVHFLPRAALTWVQIVIAALILTASWAVAAVFLFRWMRERRLHRLTLATSERRFRSLVEGSSDLLVVLSGDGLVRYMSPSLANALGTRPQEAVGTSWLSLIHPADLEAMKERLADGAMGAASRSPLEVRLTERTRWRWFEAIVDDMRKEPSVGGFVVRCHDLTRHRAAEATLAAKEEELRQAVKMEAVGRLAGGIAHDFNNLLTAAQCAAQLALDHLRPEDPGRAELEEVVSATESASALTRQLLAFGRRQMLAPEVVDLNARVRAAGRMMARLIDEDIVLEIETDPRVGPIRADPSQLDQVLVNLIVNARDAMPGGGHLTIRTLPARMPALGDEHGADRAPAAMLAVQDTGHGMTRDVTTRIFEPFFTTKSTLHGTGLGLATVYGIVQQSGGHIEVESEPDRGTTFAVYLPLIAAEPVRTPVRQQHGPDGSAPSEPLSVLLVEDEPAVRSIAARILRRGGHQVVETGVPEDALRLCEEGGQRFDLLLTDMVMPGMNGHELALELSRVQPGIRVLFMSGYTGEEVARKGLQIAGATLLQKPFMPRGLLEKVARAARHAPALAGSAGSTMGR